MRATVKGGLYAPEASAILTSVQDRRIVDRALETSPKGITTPAYIGETVLDQESSVLWRAVGGTSADWVRIDVPFDTKQGRPELLGV